MAKLSGQERKALHLGCEIIAEALNEKGLDMRTVLREDVRLPWSKQNVKDHLYRPIMRSMKKKKSTEDLERGEAGEVYDFLAGHLAEVFGVDVGDFPSFEQIMMAQLNDNNK